MQQHINKIRALGRVSRIILWGFVILWLLCFSGLPLLLGIDIELLPKNALLYQVFYWAEPAIYEIDGVIHEVSISDSASGLVNAVLALSSVVIVLVMLGVFWCVDRLFRLYSKGHVFQLSNVTYLHKIGLLLVGLFIASSVSETLISMQLGYVDEQMGMFLTEQEGGLLLQIFTLSLDSSLLLSGLFLVLISRVMKLAVELQNEVDSTI